MPEYEFHEEALAWAKKMLPKARYRIAKEGAVDSGRSMYLTQTGWSLHFEGDVGKTPCGDAIFMPATKQQVEDYAFCLKCYDIKYPKRRK